MIMCHKNSGFGKSGTDCSNFLGMFHDLIGPAVEMCVLERLQNAHGSIEGEGEGTICPYDTSILLGWVSPKIMNSPSYR